MLALAMSMDRPTPRCDDRIAELARRQLADYDAHTPGTLFDDPAIRITVEEAYGIQFEVARLRVARGESVVGYKIGCLSEVVRRQLGLDRPVFGHVFSGELRSSGAMLPLDQFTQLAIEGEFGIQMDRSGTLAAFPVIELHNNVFRRTPHTAAELIANNAIHAGVVLPGRFPLATADQLLAEEITVLRQGQVLGTARGDVLPGGPAGSILRVREHLARFGIALEPGQLILTGSPLPLYPVSAGDLIEVRSSHLGETIARIAG